MLVDVVGVILGSLLTFVSGPALIQGIDHDEATK
jgi:hypothetical protein